MTSPDTLLTDDHLRAQVKLLGTLLGQVLLQFAGEEVFETVETLRRGFAELQQQEDQQRRTELMEMIDAGFQPLRIPLRPQIAAAPGRARCRAI